MKRLVVACALALVVIPAARAESLLRSMITTDIRGLMPGISPDDNTGLVLQNIYEGLVAWRGDGTVAPMLAKEIAVSADRRSYTFTLRDDVKFHNGAALTSREVAWTWQSAAGPLQHPNLSTSPASGCFAPETTQTLLVSLLV